MQDPTLQQLRRELAFWQAEAETYTKGLLLTVQAVVQLGIALKILVDNQCIPHEDDCLGDEDCTCALWSQVQSATRLARVVLARADQIVTRSKRSLPEDV